MITISNLTKNYGRKVLFDNLSLTINRGEKIGLIGPNGAGKSTLFSVILGETEPSSGGVQVNKNIRIGYLPQELSFSRPDIETQGGNPPQPRQYLQEPGKAGRTALSELLEGDETISRLTAEKDKLESANEAHSNRYGELLHELETLGYFELEYRAKKVLTGLGFKERDFNRLISELSGGWQMRVLLGKLLVFHYDILLLDEPTNYLDLNAAIWLKGYLSAFPGTFLMISHDKAFLNEVTNYTFILENGSVFKVKGNYEHYQRIKEEKRAYLLKQYKEQEKKRKQLEKFVARFHAQPNKAQSVRAKRTILERMEEVTVPQDIAESIRDFQFPSVTPSGQKVIALNNISKSYADIEVYRDFDFAVERGEKAVLIGENGAGKSTLLKILAGVVNIDSGERSLGYNVSVGYFSQTRTDVLNLENTVLEEVYSAAPGFMAQETIRTILGAFLFTGEDADKLVKVLSGGEKSRLILAKLLINPPNFLLLDEPTTHLDVDAVDALVKALTDYQGTIVFISHDIHFVRSIANTVFEVKDGEVRKFSGNFDYYLEKKGRGENSSPLAKNHSNGSLSKENPPTSSLTNGSKGEVRGFSSRDEEKKRKINNLRIKEEIKKLKDEKERLNLEQSAKSRAVENPRSYRDDESLEEYIYRIQEIDKRIDEINDEIRRLKKQILISS